VQAINNTNGGVNSRCRPEKKSLIPFSPFKLKLPCPDHYTYGSFTRTKLF